MSDPRTPDGQNPDGQNSTGSQSGDEPDYTLVDSGLSDDIENSLTGQGTSDRETAGDIAAEEESAGGDVPNVD
jgi:hypothetical protein